jgi:hypothetical protein
MQLSDGKAPWAVKGANPVSSAIRVGCGVLLSGLWGAGYFSIGAWAQRTHAHDPSTSLDATLPFVPWAVWPYFLAIAWIAAPVALITSAPLFKRTALSYLIVIAASLLFFAAFPTLSGPLREQIPPLQCDPLTAWLIQTLHTTDPPSNMAPSLHVSLSTLATAAIVRRFPRLRAVSIAWLLTIILSVCLVKQHTVVDAITGLCAAWLALRIADRLTLGSASVEAA